MTRLELLTLAAARARHHGFEFRRWYTQQLGLPWISAAASLKLLEQQRRYVAMLFSHEFARAFWKAGEEISFEIPARSYQRTLPDGSTGIVQRKAFMRRSSRRDAWRYHLREMAVAEDPLLYLLRYFKSTQKLTIDDPKPASPAEPAARPATGRPPRSRVGPAGRPVDRKPRPLPEDLPEFLQRPAPPLPATRTRRT